MAVDVRMVAELTAADISAAELAELADKLCGAIHTWRRRHDAAGRALAAELQAAEHDAWHAWCVRTGTRCLQCTGGE